jgi:uncharacterized membrane protein
VALVGIASVAVLLGAWMVLRRARAAALHADAVVTTALACGLATAFLLLRVWATPTGETPPTLSPGTEAALRTLMLLTAGVALGMARTDGSVIARWRGEALLLAGLVHGVLWQGMFHNPLGFWAGEVSGPPLLDELTLGYIAPAGLLLGAGAMRVRRGDRRAGLYGFAGLLWAALAILLEIRRAFHGRVLNAGPELPAEMACYGLAALCLALVAAALPEALRTRASWETTAARIARSAAIVGWPAVALSALMFWSYASPWWGPLGVALRSAGDADLLFGVYAAGVAVSLALAHPRLRLGPELARAALVCAVTDLFALLTLVIRYAFQGPDMRAGLREVSLETWTYSAVWALFGLGLLLTGGIRRSPTMRWLALLTLLATAAKVFLFDMARLQGVIRAASFLALGALLLLGALAARRLNAGAGVFGRASGDRDGG